MNLVPEYIEKRYKVDNVSIFGLRGIYILKNIKTVVYIGQSRKCIISRVLTHYKNPEILFDNFTYSVIKNADDSYLNEIEQHLIRLYKPFFNITHLTGTPGLDIDNLLKLDWFNELPFNGKIEVLKGTLALTYKLPKKQMHETNKRIKQIIRYLKNNNKLYSTENIKPMS